MTGGVGGIPGARDILDLNCSADSFYFIVVVFISAQLGSTQFAYQDGKSANKIKLTERGGQKPGQDPRWYFLGGGERGGGGR